MAKEQNHTRDVLKILHLLPPFFRSFSTRIFFPIDLFVGQSVRPFLGFLAQLPSGFLRPILDAGILVNLFLPIDLLRPLLAEVWRKRFLFRHISEKENGEPLKQLLSTDTPFDAHGTENEST